MLPEAGRFYKANLHSHSTLSDGNLTPVRMKEEYRRRGYSILALSDHDVLHCSYELSDQEFLILTAYEISVRSDDVAIPHACRKVVDMNLFAKEPHNMTQVGFHPDTVTHWIKRGKILQEQADQIRYAGELRDNHYYPANINKIIRSANENGFLVSINHPVWSLIDARDYSAYEGAWAVEVYNHGCAVLSGINDAEHVFEDILRTGKKIFAVATDDNHNSFPLDSVQSDSFGGFTMIKAESLDYKTVISAMERGDFYASTGPLIEELYYEDGKVYLRCSEAAEVSMISLGRWGRRMAVDGGQLITEAVFDLETDLFGRNQNVDCWGYVRFRVTDKAGRKAYTNAYYLDELMDGRRKVRAIL